MPTNKFSVYVVCSTVDRLGDGRVPYISSAHDNAEDAVKQCIDLLIKQDLEDLYDRWETVEALTGYRDFQIEILTEELIVPPRQSATYAVYARAVQDRLRCPETRAILVKLHHYDDIEAWRIKFMEWQRPFAKFEIQVVELGEPADTSPKF